MVRYGSKVGVQWETRDAGEQLDVIFYFMWNICTFCRGDGDFYFLGRG